MRRALGLLLMAAVVGGGPAGVRGQGEPAALTDAVVVEREGAVEVWVRLSRGARYQAEFMDRPDRLVIDFDDTAYRWSIRPVPAGPDPVRELRGSQYRKGIARLVIELRRPAIYTIEQDREGLRIIFGREVVAVEPARDVGRHDARRSTSGPLVYGIVRLDQEAHAYIFDPALRQVRRYRVGDAVGEAVIETIGERHVVLRTPTGRVELPVDEGTPERATAPTRR